jgi:sortase A
MTSVLDRPETELVPSGTVDEPTVIGSGEVTPGSAGSGSPAAAKLAILWVVVTVLVMGIVLYAVEPMFQQRTQGMLLDEYRNSVDMAANQSTGLGGVETSVDAPEIGSPVGILEIGPIGLQQVIVEGVDSHTTQNGPGHVPGTAGPGQPGNAVVVGRGAMFGGPFDGLSRLAPGDQFVVTTTQGRTLYEIADVGSVTITDEPGASVAPAPESVLAEGFISLSSLYGTSEDDRLTLVTSASAFPWNTGDAEVVIAVMKGKPFAPTPQNGRSTEQTGLTGDTTRWPLVLLSFLCLGAAVAAAVVLYRRSSPKIAYLLTVPALLAFALVASENFSLMLPAWS